VAKGVGTMGGRARWIGLWRSAKSTINNRHSSNLSRRNHRRRRIVNPPLPKTLPPAVAPGRVAWKPGRDSTQPRCNQLGGRLSWKKLEIRWFADAALPRDAVGQRARAPEHRVTG
jgi:hypothetical protein